MKYMWNPWHGCFKCSAGCVNCYVYYLDSLRDIDSTKVVKSKTNFDYPLKKNKNKAYKIPSGEIVATCFTSDFFIENADVWRMDIWDMIKTRSDLEFLIPTKRINRFNDCLPSDWGDGYSNVTIGVTIENNEMLKTRMPIFLDIKAKKKVVFASPLLEKIDFRKYLKTNKIAAIYVGGESYIKARICDFAWVEDIYLACLEYNVEFDFHQTGSNFVKNGKTYKINHNKEYIQAKKAMEYLERKYQK